MPLTSFYAALTGLNNNALAISVVGNNLANLSTPGYKASKANFAELLGSTSIGSSGNPIQVGLGSSVPAITPMFSQGSIAYTGRATDVAINGNGLFVVSVEGGLGFTRAGNFGFSANGELVNSEGYTLMGYTAVNGVIDNSGALSPIVIPKGVMIPAKPTGHISVMGNLDSSAAVDTVFSSAVQAYDSLGATHTITLNFKKTGATAWSWTASVPAVDTGGAATAAPAQIGTGTITFDSKGTLTAPTTNPSLTLTGLANGAANQTIAFDILDSSGHPRFTGFSSASSVSSTAQDGYAPGGLRDINIEPTGIISGVFDNGQVQPLAQLALANFPNPEGLLKFKGSTSIAFSSSGEPSIGSPGTGGRGSISGTSLEQSNVDIATEFTNLIVAQRGYQASSKVITTTDELYQDSINMKR
jgi:flagellar hook protein FlgE